MVGEFGLGVYLIKQIKRGLANWTTIKLPQPQRVVALKQYRLPRGKKEITGTIKELAQVSNIGALSAPLTATCGQ